MPRITDIVQRILVAGFLIFGACTAAESDTNSEDAPADIQGLLDSSQRGSSNGSAGGPEDIVARSADAGAPSDSALVPDVEEIPPPPPPPPPACSGGEECFGAKCSTHEDCGAGACIDHIGNNVCTVPCEGECPSGWTCGPIDPGDSKAFTGCIPNYNHLCRPCKSDQDCESNSAQDRCLDYGLEGSFCGGDCTENTDCPDGFYCTEMSDLEGNISRQCKDIDGICQCSERAIELNLETLCKYTNAHGTCPGTRHCTYSGLQPCNAPPAAKDYCDAQDNDCDGLTDEAFIAAPSYCSQWKCSSIDNMECVDGLIVDPCLAPSPVHPDPCDAIDNDCDGKTDEGYVPTSTTCGLGPCQTTGVLNCVSGELVDSCEPIPGKGADSCDNVDDDCDGLTDEDFQPVTTSCGQGLCFAVGTTSCVAGVFSDSCVPLQGTLPDDCDGVNNDCDAHTDEDYVAPITTCGITPCNTTGLLACLDGEIMDTCYPLPGKPTDPCDFIDNDCDGDTDEDFKAQTTYCGKGYCMATGITSCDAGTVNDSCVPGTGAPFDICDGINDDCDDTTDEDYVPTPTTCGVAPCNATGMLSCVNGAPMDSCEAIIGSAGDQCDAMDNDCDGATDEDFQSQATYCGNGLCASSGTTSCVGGSVVDDCVPITGATVDMCDSIDNDCDTKTDEDYVSTPTTCGIPPCNTTGQLLCVSGTIYDNCLPLEAAVSDPCDLVDNDCDGLTDENFVAVDTLCGAGECRNMGVTACNGGTIQDTCTPLGGANSDPCDALDNDCDGLTDEDHVGSPTTCGIGECASSGMLDCYGGSLYNTCAPFLAGPSDACDGLDNDCDTSTDESFVVLVSQCGVGACTSSGLTSCTAGILADSCTPLTPSPLDGCNGIDDDCDGATDEEFHAGGSSPYASGPYTSDFGKFYGDSCGTGACAGGKLVCTADASALECTAHPSIFSTETCDDLDNDCDGLTDEGFPDFDSDGEVDCVDPDDDGDGDPDDVDCAPFDPTIYRFAPEICDGIDSDCDNLDEPIDDFDAATLDTAWVEDCTGAAPTYAFSSSNLVISGSPAPDTPSSSTDKWIFDPDTDLGNQICRPIYTDDQDFDIEFEISWSSSAAEQTMGGVALVNGQGQMEIYAGFNDDDATGLGNPFAIVRQAGTNIETQITADAGATGTSLFRIFRVAGLVSIEYNGSPLITASSLADLARLSIFHSSFENNGIAGSFGSISIGHIRWCTGECSAWLESCDGKDNDCDGLIDDGISDTPSICGEGVCKGTGLESCVMGVLNDTCTPAPAGTPCNDYNSSTVNDICDASGQCDGLLPESSCQQIQLNDPLASTGIHWIDPDGSGGMSGYEVHCDLTKDSGGWTLAAVVSEDGQDNWSWNNRAAWTSPAGLFGDIDDMTRDLKLQSLSDILFQDLLFVHQPSNAWASYHAVGDGSLSFTDFISSHGEKKCWACTSTLSCGGFAMSAGTISISGDLCSTDLFFNAQDHDGNLGCQTGSNDAHGPVWSTGNGLVDADGCPFDDPGTSGALGASSSPDPALEYPAMGFGRALNLNTAPAGSGGNRMYLYLR